MSRPKHVTKQAMPLRKTPQKRANAPVIELGVLNERLGYFVRRAQLWVFQDFIRRLSSLDISPAEFSVLVVIGANTGLSQAELATTLGIERARLVRLLHRLERRRLTQRLPSSADGRRQRTLLADAAERRFPRHRSRGLDQPTARHNHRRRRETLSGAVSDDGR